jgi:small GTP-binding protein
MDEDKMDLREVKIILLGDSGVGKTSIINRYVNNKFNPDMASSLCSSSNNVEIIKDNIKYKLIIWDTSGQEVYHSLTNLFIKGTNIAILTYAINSLTSFEGLNYWYKALIENIGINNYILAIVGTKIDLVNEEVVSEEQAKEFAKEKNAIFKLVSAKENSKGIHNLFDMLLDELIENYPNYDENKSYRYRPIKKKAKRRHCC